MGYTYGAGIASRRQGALSSATASTPELTAQNVLIEHVVE